MHGDTVESHTDVNNIVKVALVELIQHHPHIWGGQDVPHQPLVQLDTANAEAVLLYTLLASNQHYQGLEVSLLFLNQACGQQHCHIVANPLPCHLVVPYGLALHQILTL